MNNSRMWISLAMLTGGLFVTGLFMKVDLGDYYRPSMILIGFYGLLTTIALYIASRALKASNAKSRSMAILGAVGIKLLFSIFLLLAIYVADRHNFHLFAYPWLVVYGVYLLFSTGWLLGIARVRSS